MTSRYIPCQLRADLCREVGFACPMGDCGVPYLTIHHFDPTWRNGGVHRPEGMIALCSNHAQKADGGYYSNEQLRALKSRPDALSRRVSGEFDFLRREMIAIIGGNAYYRTRVPLTVDGKRWIWFNRDADGYLLLNVQFPGPDNLTRLHLEDNVWVVEPAAEDIECPTRGRSLAVRFPNGDHFKVEFREVHTTQEFLDALPWAGAAARHVGLPVTLAFFWQQVANVLVALTPDATIIGTNTFAENFMTGTECGLVFNSASAPSEPRAVRPGRPGALTAETRDLLARELRLHPRRPPQR